MRSSPQLPLEQMEPIDEVQSEIMAQLREQISELRRMHQLQQRNLQQQEGVRLQALATPQAEADARQVAEAASKILREELLPEILQQLVPRGDLATGTASGSDGPLRFSPVSTGSAAIAPHSVVVGGSSTGSVVAPSVIRAVTGAGLGSSPHAELDGLRSGGSVQGALLQLQAEIGEIKLSAQAPQPPGSLRVSGPGSAVASNSAILPNSTPVTTTRVTARSTRGASPHALNFQVTAPAVATRAASSDPVGPGPMPVRASSFESLPGGSCGGLRPGRPKSPSRSPCSASPAARPRQVQGSGLASTSAYMLNSDSHDELPGKTGRRSPLTTKTPPLLGQNARRACPAGMASPSAAKTGQAAIPHRTPKLGARSLPSTSPHPQPFRGAHSVSSHGALAAASATPQPPWLKRI